MQLQAKRLGYAFLSGRGQLTGV